MITELTEAQKASMPHYVKKWTDVALSCEPANKEEAEAAMKKMCELVNPPIDPPVMVLWYESPQAMYLAKELIIEDYMQEVDGNRALVLPGKTIEEDKAILDTYRERAVEMITSGEPLKKYKEGITNSLWNSCYGNLEAAWLAFYDFFREQCGLVEQTEELMGMYELAFHCGWVYPDKKIWFASDKPKEIHLNDRGNLHNMQGPALSYRDGVDIYAIHGVLVPAYFVKNPEQITVEKILGEENLEVKRIMCEIYGHERFVVDSGSKLIDSSSFGELYQLENDKVVLTFVNVVCPSTGRKYSIPVPSNRSEDPFRLFEGNMVTAKQAVAWTAQMKEEDYNPDIET